MIQLVLSSAPLDEVPGKVAVITFFEDVRPLRGSTELIDWRLNGRISELIVQGRLSGALSEALIMPSQGRLSADEILLFGLGRSGEMTGPKLDEVFSKVVEKLVRLKSPGFVASFGDFSTDFMSWRGVLRSFMTTLSQKAGPHQDLQVVCAEDPRWIHEAKRRNMDFGANVDLAYA